MALEQIRAKSTKKSLSGREQQCERGAADLPWTHRIEPSLIGLIWHALTQSLLSQQRKWLSYYRKPFFAGATCMDWMGGKKEHGTIFNLDVLIAAFQFGNEHLMLKVTLSGMCWQTDMRGAVPATLNICSVWWKQSFCRCIIKQRWEHLEGSKYTGMWASWGVIFADMDRLKSALYNKSVTRKKTHSTFGQS